MENNAKMTPRDFFMNLLGFFALYMGIVSLLTLLFQYINALLPDQLNFYYTGILDAIRWSSSALLVLCALFLLINWLLEKDFAKRPAKRDLAFRKWLTYFTLFAAAITIIIDLIRVLYNFYGGDLSTKFILKVLAVLLVAVGVFGYYLWDLKREADKKYRAPKIVAAVVAVIVLGSIVAGFFIVGSPATQRERRFDDQRIEDLQILQNEIINYWQLKEKLPADLNKLQDSISGFVPPVDPKTEESYEYGVTAPLAFELCAAFSKEAASLNEYETRAEPGPYKGVPTLQNWSHEAGRVCFDREIDPELYDLRAPLMAPVEF